MSTRLTVHFIILAVSVAITETVHAISDPDNLGQWNKPTRIVLAGRSDMDGLANIATRL